MPAPNAKSYRTPVMFVAAHGISKASKFYLSIPKDTKWLRIFGTTMDSNSAPLAGCTVKLFNTANDLELASTVSDGGGNYSFTLRQLVVTTFYIVAYLAGSPDVAGTTVNTLRGA